MKKILLVEDDPNLGKLLTSHLNENDLVAELLTNGSKAREAIESRQYDLCIFDIMLPDVDGLELANTLKACHSDVPFIFLSARALKSDKMHGYAIGADDYITKPFDPDELTCKIKAILRRYTPVEKVPGMITAGDFVLESKLRLLRTDQWKKNLSTKEHELLQLLFLRINEIVPRDEALEKVWGRSDYFTSKSMDVYITKIRKMLTKGKGLLLENIHGYGFRLLEL